MRADTGKADRFRIFVEDARDDAGLLLDPQAKLMSCEAGMATILIIDDDASVREMICQILSAESHRVLQAADGRIGYRLVAAHAPDLVITDIFMPNMEGIETIREIRRFSDTIKIIAISGSGSDRGFQSLYLDFANRLGADAILSKPFHAAELIEIVNECLAKVPIAS